MKKLSKIFVNLFAVLMLTVACFSAVGCTEKITTVNVNVQVYNSTDAQMQDVTLKVKLYGHLAENTVASILDRIEGGYYNDAVFYKTEDRSNQIMLGEIVEKDGEIALNPITLTEEDMKKINQMEDAITMGQNPFMMAGRMTDATATAMENAASNPGGAMNGFVGVGMAMNTGTANAAQGF